jgi:flavin reductase (DIM6/NTAB) family NADH-FMN oxidoreductase RutF
LYEYTRQAIGSTLAEPTKPDGSIRTECKVLNSVANRMVEESFVQLHPKDNFYQSVSFFPMPFALITTVNERGTTSIGPHSLAFPFEVTEQPSMMLVSRASSNTATNLRRTGKCALNFIEFDKKWLESVVSLGYPGQTPEEKMKDIPFTLTATPTQGFRDDPDYPLIIKEAFQVYECVTDGKFEYKPHRVADAPLVESFFALRIKDVLLKESCKRRLDSGHEFPDMPISYGFRGGNEFWFTRHGKPFRIPVPRDKGPPHQQVYYMANKQDPQVRFTEGACKELTGVPKPFLSAALKGIIKEAKDQRVTMVDESFLELVKANRYA